MNARQQGLLNLIITQHIKTASPIGSKFIAEAGWLELSPATVRNEMAELEAEGYIFHPHTSAGRVPTEKGYKFFIDNFLEDSGPSKKQEDFLAKALKSFQKLEPRAVKELARKISELADGTVFVAFSSNDFYYTGLSNLFSKPEFSEHDLAYDLSRVIDHFDRVINEIFDDISQEVEIVIGRENPFSPVCSAVMTRYEAKNSSGLLGILGPTRMDYQNNFSLIKYSRELINNL